MVYSIQDRAYCISQINTDHISCPYTDYFSTPDKTKFLGIK